VGSVLIDVSGIASIVDRMLTEPPGRTPSLRKYAKQLPPRTVQTRGKEGSPLFKELSSAGDAWLKVVVPDGELRRSGEAIVYVAAQPGKKIVQIFSVRAARAAAHTNS
jgi:hypothetical protein